MRGLIVQKIDIPSLANTSVFEVLEKGPGCLMVKPRKELLTATATNAGADYAEGDLITMAGGSGSGAIIRVLTVTAGAVDTFEIAEAGEGYAATDSLTQDSTTGIGTGFAVDVDTVGQIYLTMVACSDETGAIYGVALDSGNNQVAGIETAKAFHFSQLPKFIAFGNGYEGTGTIWIVY